MQFGTRKTIEDDVLASLQNRPLVILDLISLLQKQNPTLTKQGVYYAIRKLRAAQMVVVENGNISLNVSWIRTMENYFSHAKQTYLHEHSQPGSLLALHDREKIVYHFHDAITADVFWNHALLLLLSATTPEPFIAYDPHAWFFIAHPKNELVLQDAVTQENRQYLVTAGYRTPLDRYAAQFFDNNFSQYHMRETPLFEKENYYLNILGDFIIEVYINRSIAQKVHDFYRRVKNFDESTATDFHTIIGNRGRTRLVISKNTQKARKLKVKLLKHFHLKK